MQSLPSQPHSLIQVSANPKKSESTFVISVSSSAKFPKKNMMKQANITNRRSITDSKKQKLII